MTFLEAMDAVSKGKKVTNNQKVMQSYYFSKNGKIFISDLLGIHDLCFGIPGIEINDNSWKIIED